MHASPEHRASTSPAGSPSRIQYLHLVAAARVDALRPASPQQIADIVRVTVDDELDTGTFAAIVADVEDAALRRQR